MALVLGGGFLAPLASATTLYQAANVSITANNTPGFNSCSGSEYFAFANDGSAADGGVESDIGNNEGELTTSFFFPNNLESGSVTITAPQGPAPAAVVAANAPWGTVFSSTNYYADNAAAGSYGCTLPVDKNGNPTQTFYVCNYMLLADFPAGSAQPGNWYFCVDSVTVSNEGNQVTIPFDFTGFGAADHMTIWAADMTNPVEGTYNGVQYSVLVDDNVGNSYSDVPAPSQTSVTYVSSTPDQQTSTLTETVPSGGDTIAATNDPAAGATITATIYDAYYNPVANQPIFIGVYSGSGAQTEPVSEGTGNGEPVTDATGQASYYAWGSKATPAGDPDEFFGEITNLFSIFPFDLFGQTFYIVNAQGVVETTALIITAATPNPPSGGGSYMSSVNVYPSSGQQQSTTITVDQSATVMVTLQDQFGNDELDNAVALVPILSANQATNDFKDVGVEPDTPPGGYDYTSGTDFACDQGPASEVPGASCTNDFGQTSFTITDTKTQTVTFEITDLTDGYTFPYTDLPPMDQANIPVVTFTAGPTSPATSTVNVNGGSSANVLADGTTQATINVSLRDDKGNPEPSKMVYLEPSNANSTILPISGVTNAAGNTSFQVSSSILGSVQYTAYDETDSLNLNDTAQTVTVNFVTGSVSSTLSTVQVAPATVVGDGQGASTVTVTVVDEGSHPLAGETVALDSSSYPNLTVVPPAVISDSNGEATFTVRSTSPENVALPVDVGATSPTTLANKADIKFTGAPKFTSITAAPTGVTENDGQPEATGSADENVTVSLADGSDTGIDGLTIELVAGDATSGTTLLTNTSGVAVFPVSLASTTSEFTVIYTALDVSDNYRLVGSVTVTFVPIPDEEHESTVLPSTQSVYTYDASQPDGTQTAVVTVTLNDLTGTPIVGNTVILTPNSTFATVTPIVTEVGVAAGTSDDDGQAAFDVTDCNPDPAAPACAPETVILTAKDTTSGATMIEEATVNFVLRPDEAETSTITVNPTVVEANGHAAAVVTVTLLNNGVSLTGDTVTLSQGSAHTVITTSDPVSNASGQVRFNVTDLTAESVALQATDLTTATELVHDAVVTFTAPPGGTLQPSVTSISPSSGPGSGGTDVTVVGTNLLDATAVDFGTIASPTFAVNLTGTELVAVSPIPIAAGSFNVTVTGPGGTSTSSASDLFEYTTGPALTVAALSPNGGSLNAATPVVISGTDLINATNVSFGSAVAKFTVSTNGTITAVAPITSKPGLVHVTVTAGGHVSALGTVDEYAYFGAPTKTAAAVPTIKALSPASGSVAGGNLVTIRGANFTEESSVLFGTHRAVVVAVNHAHTLLTVRVPAIKAPGVVRVTVQTTVGRTVSSTTDRYTYKAKAKAKSKLRSPQRSASATVATTRTVAPPKSDAGGWS
jgi:hypothetical protein